MNKIVIKGRIQPKHDMVKISEKHSENLDKNKDGNDGSDMLYKISEHD